MLKKDKYILVLGSKPDSIIPQIEVTKIYAANGAAERASSLINIFPDIQLTSVVGGLEFKKNPEVQKRVIESSPDYLISRVSNIDIQNYNFSKKMIYKFFSNNKQLMIQSNFFKFSILDIILKEMYYEQKIIDKFKHLLRTIKNGNLTGVSTGFFAVLCALKEHPDKEIIISGIGMSGGGHYYDVNSNRYSKRSLVDRKLILNLKNKFKKKLYTTDQNLALNGNIKIWRH